MLFWILLILYVTSSENPNCTIKIKETIDHWKHHHHTSICIFDDIIKLDNLKNGSTNSTDDDYIIDDCVKTSFSAYDDDYFDHDWDPILHHPHPNHKCQYVGPERKRHARLHFPSSPIHNPK